MPTRGGVLREDDGRGEPTGARYELGGPIIDYLFGSGFTHRVHQRTGLMMDLYEEELAPPDKLSILLAILDEELGSLRSSGNQSVRVLTQGDTEIDVPRSLVEDAISGTKEFLANAARSNRGVWFIF